MAEPAEQGVPDQIVLYGFHQGSRLVDGVPGPIGNFMELKNTTTGKILNVAIDSEAMRQVLGFLYKDEGQVEEDSPVLASPAPIGMDEGDPPPDAQPELEPEPTVPGSVFGGGPEEEVPVAEVPVEGVPQQ